VRDPDKARTAEIRGGHGAAAALAQKLPERLEKDGTTITVGDPTAEHTFLLVEDPRCPVCEEFELTGGAKTIVASARKGDLRVQYRLASFLDDRLSGHGSVKAVNALRAALEQGKFLEYHDVLYANQPPEEVDGFTDSKLLALASKVPGLRGKEFDSAVKTMRYRSFVEASEQVYETDSPAGTPEVRIDGTSLPDGVAGAIFDKDLTSVFIEATVAR
jgi:protein-disulfide isomerase